MQGRHGHLSREQKQLALRLHARGWRLIDIAREIGCTAPMVGKMAREGRHVDGKPFGWQPREGHLTVLEREQILVGLARGDSLAAIVRDLRRAVSTISREVRRGGGRAQYSAWRAHERAREQSRRRQTFRLGQGPLLEDVSARLKDLWSPQEIAARLRLEYPDRPEMHVSHETIYQSLFVQGRGQLRRELTRCLRSGRGLLRQYLPKSTDLSVVIRDELTAIQDSLNGRPRKTLGYLTPSEKFAELVATTGWIRHRVRAAQLMVLPLELGDLLRVARARPGPLARIDLCLRDPVAQRLGIDPQLLTDPGQRPDPGRGVTRQVDRHPDRTLPKLLRVLPRSCHDSHPSQD